MAATALLVLSSGAVQAAPQGNNQCPVGLVSGKTLNEEFGAGTQDLTHCLTRRSNVKVVVQINQFCQDAAGNSNRSLCLRPYALGNIANMLDDYETTHGMRAGVDYEIVAVVHSGGGYLMVKDSSYNGGGLLVSGRNQFEATVKSLMSRGVKFLFCQNTTRAFIAGGYLPDGYTAGGATAQIIEGVEYTTAGLTSIVDLQDRGYRYIQP